MNLTEVTRNRLLLGLIVFLGLALRLFHLALLPLWRDETFTRFYSEQSLPYLWTTGFGLESNPPGYYTLMHGWMLLFGTSEAALRSVSVIAAILTIPIIYALGKTMANARVGLIGALIFALCPGEIWYAQEARTYALLQVPLGLSLLGLAQFLARPSATAPLILYALGAIAAAYCHDTILLAVAACNLAVVGTAWGRHSLLGRRDLIRWLLVNAVVGLAILPPLLMARRQVGGSSISWMPHVGFSSLAECFSEVLDGKAAAIETLHTHPWILMLVLAAALSRPGAMDRRKLIVLVLVPAFFIMLMILLSLHQSMIIPRAFFWVWIPLSVLLGLAIERGIILRWAVLVATIAVFGLGLRAYYFPHVALKEDWRDLSVLGAGAESPSALIVLNTWVSVGPLAYYHPEVVSRVRFLHDPATPREFMELFLSEKFHVPELDAEGLSSVISSSQPVYLLTQSDAPGLPLLPASLPTPGRSAKVYLGFWALHLSTWNSSDNPSLPRLPQPN